MHSKPITVGDFYPVAPVLRHTPETSLFVSGVLYDRPLFGLGRGRQAGNRGSPAARVYGFVVVNHEGMIFQDAAHAPAERAGSLSVNDAHLSQALLVTGAKVLRHEVAYVGGVEDVEVEHAVDWILFHKDRVLWVYETCIAEAAELRIVRPDR